MTTTQLDHLNRIDAHLANLIENAKKRTPGRWKVYGHKQYHPGVEADSLTIVMWGSGDDDGGVRTGMDDAAYIASCAGNAEAGWIATRAAIAWIVAGPVFSDQGTHLVETILAAFPLELLDS